MRTVLLRAVMLWWAVSLAACNSGSQVGPAPGCAVNADCVSPGACEVETGASCRSGTCDYPARACVQAAPVNVCMQLDGACVSTGGCSGAGCCTFAPIWNGAGASPTCPLAGQDPEGDGTVDSGETWTGRCDAGGQCRGCSVDAECNDAEECTTDSCGQGGICTHDGTPNLGVACAVHAPGDGACAPVGDGASCRLAAGNACTSNAECASAACVCADDGCSARVCHETGCPECSYDPDGAASTACLPTTAGRQGVDCTAAGTACDASRHCVSGLGNGETCSAATECASGHCECASGTCSSRICNAVDCTVCRFAPAGGTGACTGFILSDLDDGDDSCGTLACNGQGECLRASGASCTADYQCAAHQCECANAICSSRVCSAVDCVLCRYASAGGTGACTGFIGTDVDDADDSCGTLACNGQGGCLLADGASCMADYECAIRHCTYSDDACTTRVCAAHSPPAPSLTSITHTSGVWSSASTLTVTAAECDAAATISYCKDVTNVCDPATAGSGSTWVALADGDHYVRAKACRAGLCSAVASFNARIDATAPSGGSVTNLNGSQTSPTITVAVNRGSDAASGLSASDGDYLLEVAVATFSAGTCGAFGTYDDAGVAETSTATSYGYTGASGHCYRFRYTVTDVAGNATTYTGTSITTLNP